MSYLVQPRLINDPFSDPGLFVDFRFGRRAILFDAGELAALSSRELLRVSDVFITHRHMDHFAGFDRLLRIWLHRQGTLRVIGPKGMTAAIDSRLQSYLWNLLDENSIDLTLMVAEFCGERLGPWTAFPAREAFRPHPAGDIDMPPGHLLVESDFCIQGVTLDHGTPCLAFALQERLRVNVRRTGLEARGLPVGPWLNEAKSAVRRGEDDDLPIAVAEGRTVALGELKDGVLLVGRGQRIVYVTDVSFHPKNAEKIIELARGADHLFIEAAFLDEDREIAAARKHLTARQAGWLARRAGVSRLTTFHYSPRYLSRATDLDREAQTAFRGHSQISVMPAEP